MAPPGGKDLTLTIYGLDVHADEVDAVVFADKLKKVISALKKLDSFYNAKGQHKFMINDLKYSSATVVLREKEMKSKRIRQSPSRRFAEIGSMASRSSNFDVNNSADEYALKTFENISKGSGKNFSYGIVESPDFPPVRIDGLLERRARDMIAQATSIAQMAPPKYFRGVAIETFDGLMKMVDVRGLFPEARLILSAGGKEISCIVSADEVDMLRASFGRRVQVTGRAQHSGRMMLPDRIDVVSIKIIDSDTNVLSLQGAIRNFNPDFIREFG